MNIFLLIRSIKYFLLSGHSGGHGIHSPYLFNFFSDITENKRLSGVVKSVEEARRRLLADRRRITVNDLGSGSLKMEDKTSNTRRISEIARYSAIRKKYVGLVGAMASKIDGKPVIELGTSLGLGTMALALSAPKSVVITIEGCINTAAMARYNFMNSGVENVEVRVGDIGDLLPGILNETGAPGLIYLDANHRKEALLSYFDTISGFIDDDTILIVDDIHLSRGMEEGWKEIVGKENVSVSVDLLQLGILLFRKGLTKQDFVIRY